VRKLKAYSNEASIEDFMRRHMKPFDAETDNYFREPFARDTKVGKNSAIYNAHSYHTKVPPEGIVPYILHYTDPGDIVLDPFCGSGMTGVAAMMCKHPVLALITAGAQVGTRRAILNDLSPAACHITYNNTHPVNVELLETEFERIMEELNEEFEWLYGTVRNGNKAIIQYTIWSDIVECFRCAASFTLWDQATDRERGEVPPDVPCPKCGVVAKRIKFHKVGTAPVRTYSETVSRKGRGKREEYFTTSEEVAHIKEIEEAQIPYWYPNMPFGPDREMWRGGHRDSGINQVHKFYTKRNLWALSALWGKIQKVSDPLVRSRLMATHTAATVSTTKMVKAAPNRAGRSNQPGTLYIPPFQLEQNVAAVFRRRFDRVLEMAKAQRELSPATIGGIGSADDLQPIPDNTIDYIFTDPPFGSNIFYSDCSILWEAWLQNFTDVSLEAVWNKSLKPTDGGKTLDEYARIMARAFAEMHRVLKPGRWASVVFSNSDDKVWQAIREGAKAAGFDLANTVALDKKQRSFKQVKGERDGENVVGTDIIMNLHKKAQVSVQVTDVKDLDGIVLSIIRRHLEELPRRIEADPKIYSNSLRTTDALYSVVIQEMMRQHLSNRGVTMPYVDDLCGAAFKKVNGRWYLPSEDIHTSWVLTEIQDEPSAIAWLRARLERRATTFAELVPEWRQATLMVNLTKGLLQILEENFWHEADTNRWRLPTDEERSQMSDEHTLRLKRRLRQVLDDKAEPLPTDQELLELLLFAYQELSDDSAAVKIYGRLNISNLTTEDKSKANRIYRVSLVKSQTKAVAEEANDQPSLF
jgi:DNA modification methylase